jgi:hypothetical protein
MEWIYSMDSIWIPCGICLALSWNMLSSLMECTYSIWNPYGMGIWIPHGFHVHSIEYFHMDSIEYFQME